MNSLILNVNGVDCELSEMVNDRYFISDVLNEIVNKTRHHLRTIHDFQNHPALDYKLYVYEEQKINGFSAKYEGAYLVGISTGALLNLYEWFDLWSRNKDVRTLFNIDEADRGSFVKQVLQTAINFLAAHEYYHILNGHCDLPENEEYFLHEKTRSVRDKEHALFLQCLEYDADCCGTAACINQITYNVAQMNAFENFMINLAGYSNDDKTKKTDDAKIILNIASEKALIQSLRILYFGIYGVFKKFSEDESLVFEDFWEDNPYISSHPYAGIRMDYLGALIVTVLERVFGSEKAVEYWSCAFEKIMRFEADILAVSDSKNLFFSIALTEKGRKITSEISNAWCAVKPRIEKYTYHKLAPIEEIEPLPAIINKMGDII